jgi:pimeloyl-ACP methyl ester carboxylesterase
MIELAYREFGDVSRPPIILLHGLFGSSANWGTIARRLADRYHGVVPDLRNHGQSSHHPANDYPSMAADVLALMDLLSLSRVAMVGHSMGGKVAMHLALTTPQRVERLAVIDMSPVRYTHDFNEVLRAFGAVDLSTVRSRADADAQMRLVLPAGGVRAFLLQNLTKQAGRWSWRLNLAALAAAQKQIIGFPDHADAANFSRPTTFIHGELSDYVQPSHHDAIAALFPKASLCEVPAAGHWVYADRPEGFMACLEPFLDG